MGCVRLSSMTNQTPSRPLPLFPLPTVLVPGASLGLRIFEPRYLDPEQLGALVKKDTEYWGGVIRSRHITAD